MAKRISMIEKTKVTNEYIIYYSDYSIKKYRIEDAPKSVGAFVSRDNIRIENQDDSVIYW